MQFLGKNVATGVYIDLQLWPQCLLARAMGMDIYGYSDTSQCCLFAEKAPCLRHNIIM